jgi:hypothetical protein
MTATTKGAASAAPVGPPLVRCKSGTRLRRVGDFPYLPAHGAGLCDLCAHSDTLLARVVLEDGRIHEQDGRKVVRCARVAFVCRRHRGEEVVGAPVVLPRMQTRKGTSEQRPQDLALFDSTALKVGARGGVR